MTNSPDGQWQSPELVEEGWMGVQLEGMCTGIAVDPLNRAAYRLCRADRK